MGRCNYNKNRKNPTNEEKIEILNYLAVFNPVLR